MKQAKFLLLLIVVLAFASCGSDEPRYADPEAHEKTVQLNEQYGPLMVGTWHYENISDTQCYFERLTFQADGTPTKRRFDSKDFTSKTRMDGLPSCVAMQNRVFNKIRKKS